MGDSIGDGGGLLGEQEGGAGPRVATVLGDAERLVGRGCAWEPELPSPPGIGRFWSH